MTSQEFCYWLAELEINNSPSKEEWDTIVKQLNTVSKTPLLNNIYVSSPKYSKPYEDFNY